MTMTTTTTTTTTRKQIVYFCRHAEAEHNIKERQAVQDAIARGVKEKGEQEKCRRSVLNDAALQDAPLSSQGIDESRKGSSELGILNKIGLDRYPRPTVVLVSPLRRALMTATELFYDSTGGNQSPKFVALEALREKRTGFAADERSAVDVLQAQFPHVDFSDLKIQGRPEIAKGEDNHVVRARAKAFLEGPLATMREEESVALVTHKGWLRELRHNLKAQVDTGDLQADFDVDHWHQTLYKNAEVRVAQFGWDDQSSQLATLVSRSLENAMGSVVEDAVKHLMEKSRQIALMSMMSTTSHRPAKKPKLDNNDLTLVSAVALPPIQLTNE